LPRRDVTLRCPTSGLVFAKPLCCLQGLPLRPLVLAELMALALGTGGSLRGLAFELVIFLSGNPVMSERVFYCVFRVPFFCMCASLVLRATTTKSVTHDVQLPGPSPTVYGSYRVFFRWTRNEDRLKKHLAHSAHGESWRLSSTAAGFAFDCRRTGRRGVVLRGRTDTSCRWAFRSKTRREYCHGLPLPDPVRAGLNPGLTSTMAAARGKKPPEYHRETVA